MDPLDPVDPGMESLFRILGVFCDRSETLTPPETVFAQKVLFFGEKKAAGGRRAPTNRAFCHKGVFFNQKVHVYYTNQTLPTIYAV